MKMTFEVSYLDYYTAVEYTSSQFVFSRSVIKF